MGSYIIRRVLLAIPTLIIVSIVAFIVIELPPGDFVDLYIKKMESQNASAETVENLRHRYGLDQPSYVRYLLWAGNFAQGDLGYSLSWNKPVRELLLSRMALTITVSLAAMVFTWALAIPIGIISAVRQYSLLDYFWTFIGFLGLSVPGFLLALLALLLAHNYLHMSIGGLFSPEWQDKSWSAGKLIDLLKHLWIPMIVIGASGTAGLIRIVRANLLDELKKPYVETARAKGLSEFRLILKYPVRIAINPLISSVGWLLPALISGETITAVVLGLPTAGPLFLGALQRQDMQLAGAFVMLTATLTVIGMLISDVLLAVVDPRIRYE